MTTTNSLATGLAAAAMVAAPVLMKIGGGGKAGASISGAVSGDSSEQCIRTATDVLRKANGGEVGIKLAKGTQVETIGTKSDFSRISYSHGGKAHTGWVPSDVLGDCTKHKPAQPLPGEEPNDHEAGEGGDSDGDWSDFNNCPLSGKTKQAMALSLNPMKNRFEAPETIDPAITLDAIMAPGDDEKRWSMTDAASIEGFVVEVKPGGPESCNCGATDPQFKDTHIAIAVNAGEKRGNHQMIVEVTPRWRAIMAERGVDWSTTTLHDTLVGKRVRITGWMFYDREHWNASENTKPGHPGNWRATAWEIHPVTTIEPL